MKHQDPITILARHPGKPGARRDSDGAVFSAPVLLQFTCWLLLALSAPALSAGPTPKLMKIITQKSGDTTRFLVDNREASDITVTFDLKLENLSSSTNFPFTSVYPPNQVTEAFTLSPIRPESPWKYEYTSHFTLGSTTVAHDDARVYLLPYAPGSAFRVSQAYHGQYSHTGPEEYAIDWKMPVGTPVHAARDGLVVKVKSDSDEGGADRKYEGAANYILVRHADGTLANYAHLAKDGSTVRVRDRVRAGDLIGFSGNTGFSTGPHLHFAVFKTRTGAERQSLPVKFATDIAPAITLVEGQTYRSRANAAVVTAAPAAPLLSPKAESLWGHWLMGSRAQGGSRRSK